MMNANQADKISSNSSTKFEKIGHFFSYPEYSSLSRTLDRWLRGTTTLGTRLIRTLKIFMTTNLLLNEVNLLMESNISNKNDGVH